MNNRAQNENYKSSPNWYAPAFAIGTLVIISAFSLWLFYSSPADEPMQYQPISLPNTELKQQAENYFRECESGIDEWISAQVDYPEQISIQQGNERSYLAAIDIRQHPNAPESVIHTENSRGIKVAVKCTVAARLIPVGGGVEINDTAWTVRTFTPSGVVNWSWSIKGIQPGTKEVNLLIEPTLSTSDGTIIKGSERVTTFVTKVDVKQSKLQRLGQSAEKYSPIVFALFGLAGAAVIGFVNWTGRVRSIFRSEFGNTRRRNS